MNEEDRQKFYSGTHPTLYRIFGALPSGDGVQFRVWAPQAQAVDVVGDWNGWNGTALDNDRGIWSIWIPGVPTGSRYKFRIRGADGAVVDKSDPFARWAETAPSTASIVWDLGYSWDDAKWLAERPGRQARSAPIAIYEVHLGSWRRPTTSEFFNYRDIAEPLIQYVLKLGFTHVELMPITEHPYYGSWGYQVTGFFSATSRYGSPQDLMFLIDRLHQAGIGVLLDWVPGHFPVDEHGLGKFDGTPLFEHPDPKLGFHPEWGSHIFNYTRPEVRSFLLSSAIFWCEYFHADGLRIDGIASLLYRDYARSPGNWVPNDQGGNEYWEAAELLRQVNQSIHPQFPGVITCAEDSTNWPKVTYLPEEGGLGFDYKWDMGWMNDTLRYFQTDPLFRKDIHTKLTFRSIYQYNESFLLPLSHDEVVHGKYSLPDKMPGDAWNKLANVRLLLGWMYMNPGKKLLFMGGEFGQWKEWDHDRGLHWDLTDHPQHAGIQTFVTALNQAYRQLPAMHEGDSVPQGFRWLNGNDEQRSVISFLRYAIHQSEVILVIANFTPVILEDYWVGAPHRGVWNEVLNSDDACYGGSGVVHSQSIETDEESCDGHPFRLRLTLPPLGVVWLRHSNT